VRTFQCPSCGSSHLRRSLPQDGWERLIRALTPLHYYRCRDCGARGSHWGEIAFGVPSGSPPLPSRPIEERDRTALVVKRRRAAFLVMIAIGAGMLTGMTVHACQPPPPAAAP
jgi:hypothetical protein